jgi:hypothetical protein
MVTVDVPTRSIVIAIRGSWSLTDIFTDALAEPLCVGDDPRFNVECLDHAIDPADAYVHKGFWQSAANILTILKCECGGVVCACLCVCMIRVLLCAVRRAC